MDPFNLRGELLPEEQVWQDILERAYAAVDAHDPAGAIAAVTGHPRFASTFWSLPLLQYAIESGAVGAVGALLRAGVSADAVDELGATPLMIAAAVGNIEIVRLLLDAGADPNVLPEQHDRDVDPGQCGRSALYEALIREHRAVIDLLAPVTRPDIRALAEEAAARDRPPRN
ncbi:carboxylate clamp-tetratricopeptide repeat protein : BnaC01g39920D protein OS=Brassica napus GN=BnaC01g39920D PE=4 SV=1: Ank_2 [Gemmata massiliana]|uniref:Peptidase A2 domain-containing protein n=1 Tax=Gemmata massiliana TaxID=1210884 RepID=A0A6P2CX43_9BACT|nr:ankyrin repeat domain-containing protein [Gemmata massiliana]VTR93147.1 carboxylate clamp-tetratricopeptide repeat protein : BnaC01g39920D protein OS=Brassica napus GN=BnaC01g39920D PE=4 SV=1: Ank_2 [Gemmata massiliana]